MPTHGVQGRKRGGATSREEEGAPQEGRGQEEKRRRERRSVHWNTKLGQDGQAWHRAERRIKVNKHVNRT